MESLYNGHHWDQQTCPFNGGVLCQGVSKDSKWDKKSVPCSEVCYPEVSFISQGFHVHVVIITNGYTFGILG